MYTCGAIDLSGGREGSGGVRCEEGEGVTTVGEGDLV